MKKLILILALLSGLPLGIVALTPMPNAEAQVNPAPRVQYATFGEALWAAGYRSTIAKVDGSSRRARGVFDPTQPYLGLKTGGRYGWPELTIGPVVGPEGTAPDMLQAVIRQPSNPFQIKNHDSYEATWGDLYDALYVRSGQSSVWNNVILPQFLRLQASQSPPPVVTPPVVVVPPVVTPPIVVPPVVEPPKPEPAIPPCSFHPEGIEPEAVITPRLVGWTYYRPGTQSTGRLTLEVVAERPCRVVKP